ncbi:MAG TPA: AMP-binding protein, partial [Polyangiaceae bacterium]|nr:AMP-binding protein [Polyangiaceae bacterium]
MLTSGIDWSARSYDDLCARFRWRIPDTLNIAEVCDASDRTALIESSGRRYSFRELKELSDRMALLLREIGVEREERVAVLLPQCVENPLAHLGAFKLGAVSVPLSPHFRREALRHRLGASRARVVITDSEHAAMVSELDLPHLKAILCCDEDGPEPLWPALERTHGPFEPVRTQANDPAILLYTSGTEGLPKGALHAHRVLAARLGAFELIHRLEAEPGERPFYTPAEWAWVAGLVDSVFTPWALGCSVLAHRPRFDAGEALELMRQVRGAFVPPTALRRMREVDGPMLDAGILDAGIHSAGEPLEPELRAWAEQRFCSVHELYGMTEIGALIGSSPFVPPRPGRVGKPYPGHELTLLEEGIIAVRRDDPGLMLGYFEDAAATEARCAGDWFLTGDIARRDEDGYFAYVGRADDVFNTSGYRVGPSEIERTLMRHPSVALAAVVPESDAERGAVPKAFVVLGDGVQPSEALASELRLFVRNELAAYQAPRRVVFARELPTT